MAEDKKSDFVDPAEYLSNKTEFHDCHLMVGDPATHEVEKIAVVKSHLVAHSSVFRDMLMDSNLADPTGSSTFIKDVRPEIFKLMLKHMYGGSLQVLKTMDKEKILELAFCADKYNVQRLVEKTCKLMIPRNVNEVFVPLRFISYVQTPVLVPAVVKIMQEESDKIIQHSEFLNLDENCVEFFAKQEKLAIEEVDLWQALLKWSEYQAEKLNLDIRDMLKKPLAHVRFVTFSTDQITKELACTGILTPTEIVQLLTSKASEQIIDIPGLCKNTIKREKVSSVDWDVDDKSYALYSLTPDDFYTKLRRADIDESRSVLNLKNISKTDIAIVSVEFKSKDYTRFPNSYQYKCEVSMIKHVDGYCSPNGSFYVEAEGTVIRDNIMVMPLRLSTGRPKYCIVEPGTECKVYLNFSTEHPRFEIVGKNKIAVNNCEKSDGQIRVMFTGQYLHVLKVQYKVH